MHSCWIKVQINETNLADPKYLNGEVYKNIHIYIINTMYKIIFSNYYIYNHLNKEISAITFQMKKKCQISLQ